MNQDYIAQLLARLPRWTLVNKVSIQKEFKMKDFSDVIEAINKIARLAETAQHHPDLYLHGWNNLTVTLSTHSAGGLTAKDFDLAKQIDDLHLDELQ